MVEILICEGCSQVSELFRCSKGFITSLYLTQHDWENKYVFEHSKERDIHVSSVCIILNWASVRAICNSVARPCAR